MNPAWLVRNVINFWPTTASTHDFIECLMWLYSPKLPKSLWKKERLIRFRHDAPVGDIELLLRANQGSDSFIYGEVFDHEYYRLPLKAPPATILDLGANTGMTAVYFGRSFPHAQLALVEPVPDNVKVLEKNLELNAIRATVFAAAADVRDGVVRMELLANDYGHRVANADANLETIEVPSLSIPTIMQRLRWQRIGLLKVDIEGHEAALFSSDCDWLDRVDAVCIECHEGFGESDLRSLAGRFGFAEPRQLPGIWFMQRA